jgi:hypothetical protein
MSRPGRSCAATSRAPARHVPPKTTRRTRRAPSPCAPSRGSSESSRGLTRRAVLARSSPQTTGPSAASRRTHAGRGRRTTAESPPSPQRHRWGLPYKNRAPCPSSRQNYRLPCHPRRRWSTASSGYPHRKPTPPTHPLGTLEACVVAYLLGIARRRRSCTTSQRSPPAIAVRRRRVPFRPNTERPRALGELTLLHAPLHDRECRRPRRNWPSRAAPMAKATLQAPTSS